ncbi:hypothetical protein IRY61_03285, partial [Candidatus Saccharibacteria bacterium]|nr:hypothetical protein [Candidatus Saccharibacteria bacterium]
MARGVSTVSPDSNYQQFDTEGRRRLLIIILIVASILVIIGVIILRLARQEEQTQTPPNPLYSDPYSGEEISDPPGKTPETFGTDPNAPTFFGQSKLLDVGISHFQVRGMQDGVYKYFKSQSQQVREVSVVVDTINVVPRSRFSDSTKNTVQFDIVADRKTTYKVTMDYFDIRSIQLYIADETGKQLFDSGV